MNRKTVNAVAGCVATTLATISASPAHAAKSSNEAIERPDWIKKAVEYLEVDTADKVAGLVGKALKSAAGSLIGDAALEMVGLKQSMTDQLAEMRDYIVREIEIANGALRNDERLGEVDALIIRWSELMRASRITESDLGQWKLVSQVTLSTMEQFFDRADPRNAADARGLRALGAPYAALSALRVVALLASKDINQMEYHPEVVREAIERSVRNAYRLVGAHRAFLDNGAQTRVQTFTASKLWLVSELAGQNLKAQSSEFRCREHNGAWVPHRVELTCNAGCPVGRRGSVIRLVGSKAHTVIVSDQVCQTFSPGAALHPVGPGAQFNMGQLVDALSSQLRNELNFQFEDRFSSEPAVRALRALLNGATTLGIDIHDPNHGRLFLGNSWFETVGQVNWSGSMKSDLGVYRPSNGAWYIHPLWGGAPFAVFWGGPGFPDQPEPGDFDGDGFADLTIYRNGEWHVRSSANAGLGMLAFFGLESDIPVMGDYDGDGTRDVAVYRPSSSSWWISPSGRSPIVTFTFGSVGDVPVSGEFDGDGYADFVMFSGGRWSIRDSSGGDRTVYWGIAGDEPVAGDFDGDARSDLAIFRPSNGTFHIMRSSDGTGMYFHTSATHGDTPVVADFDGDGRSDAAFYRPNGEWRSKSSPNSIEESRGWGLPGDKVALYSTPGRRAVRVGTPR